MNLYSLIRTSQANSFRMSSDTRTVTAWFGLFLEDGKRSRRRVRCGGVQIGPLSHLRSPPTLSFLHFNRSLLLGRFLSRIEITPWNGHLDVLPLINTCQFHVAFIDSIGAGIILTSGCQCFCLLPDRPFFLF